MPVRKPPQRSEDQLPNGHMSEPIKQQVREGQDDLEMASAALARTRHRGGACRSRSKSSKWLIAYRKWYKAESIMPQRNPPQRSEDQISTGHMLEPIAKQQMAYSV